MMRAVRSRGGKAEVELRHALWSMGLRYRLHAQDLIGKPDMVFRRERVAIFVDGDFWHGRGLVQDGPEAFAATLRTERREWWLRKLARNVERDNDVTTHLQRDGWIVVRLWESDVLADAATAAKGIRKLVRERRLKPRRSVT